MQNKKNIATTWRMLAAALLLLLAGCGGSGGSPAPGNTSQRGGLVSVTSTSTIDVAVVNAYISALASNYSVDTSPLNGTRYGVSVHHIIYKTVAPDGRLIDASGVLAYPLKPANVGSPLLSYQHGTIFTDAEAPSLAANIDPVLVALAGSGFIVAMPDYTGYAASTNEIHTYVHAQGLAAATVDMLRATRHLLVNNNVAANGQLFLTGYSEGGYATLAAQKEMEQNLPAEFPVTASMPAAGPYDMSGTAQYIVGLATNPSPELLGFVFKAYDHWYGWKRINDVFQSPYNAVIASNFDGSQGGGAIHAALTTDSATLFNTGFRASFLGNGETLIKADFAKNDIYNWSPAAPTHLYHGQDDTVVPYFNATTAQTTMTAAGSTSVALVNCTTPPLVPRGHSECAWDYLSQVIGWFVPLASNL